MGITTSKATPEEMEQIRKHVLDLIEKNAVIVFSKTYCPFCKQTKSSLASLNAKFKTVELDEIEDGSKIQDFLEEYTKQRSVPNIFINKKHIGGNSDLQKKIKEGTIQKMLKEIPAQSATSAL
ncbi:hypothetical protein H4219_001509 [Mycoemilia scoparia]|uniref:Glutaredoxin domain-containing protein n=1 Tax=Mycoemilia scoparia TaxID=417184 RepID=A0A9W8A9B4_9FUNG|nr:hypothetical protein H4219_001509 [Mycoemilia scoparia]